ncbi:hypothetical protein LguiB_013133 [Lonicera macranthoides]
MLKVSKELQHLLFDSSRQPGNEQRSQRWIKITNRKSQRIEENKGRCTYVEVVAKKQWERVNKFGNVEAKNVDENGNQSSQVRIRPVSGGEFNSVISNGKMSFGTKQLTGPYVRQREIIEERIKVVGGRETRMSAEASKIIADSVPSQGWQIIARMALLMSQYSEAQAQPNESKQSLLLLLPTAEGEEMNSMEVLGG